jgi:hypothetical protein
MSVASRLGQLYTAARPVVGGFGLRMEVVPWPPAAGRFSTCTDGPPRLPSPSRPRRAPRRAGRPAGTSSSSPPLATSRSRRLKSPGSTSTFPAACGLRSSLTFRPWSRPRRLWPGGTPTATSGSSSCWSPRTSSRGSSCRCNGGSGGTTRRAEARRVRRLFGGIEPPQTASTHHGPKRRTGRRSRGRLFGQNRRSRVRASFAATMPRGLSRVRYSTSPGKHHEITGRRWLVRYYVARAR